MVDETILKLRVKNAHITSVATIKKKFNRKIFDCINKHLFNLHQIYSKMSGSSGMRKKNEENHEKVRKNNKSKTVKIVSIFH